MSSITVVGKRLDFDSHSLGYIALNIRTPQYRTYLFFLPLKISYINLYKSLKTSIKYGCTPKNIGRTPKEFCKN